MEEYRKTTNPMYAQWVEDKYRKEAKNLQEKNEHTFYSRLFYWSKMTAAQNNKVSESDESEAAYALQSHIQAGDAAWNNEIARVQAISDARHNENEKSKQIATLVGVALVIASGVFVYLNFKVHVWIPFVKKWNAYWDSVGRWWDANGIVVLLFGIIFILIIFGFFFVNRKTKKIP